MPRARSRTIPIRSTSPAAPRNSRPHMLFPLAESARESLAPASPSLSRSRQESRLSNPSAPLGLPFQTPAASLRSARSLAQTALRSSIAAAVHHFPFPILPASKDSPRVAATPPIRILSPDSPPPRAVTLRPPSSRCPAPRPSARGFHFPARASTAETTIRPAPAVPRPAAPDPAAPVAMHLSPLPPNRPPRFDISLQAPAATRISLPARHPQSK